MIRKGVRHLISVLARALRGRTLSSGGSLPCSLIPFGGVVIFHVLVVVLLKFLSGLFINQLPSVLNFVVEFGRGDFRVGCFDSSHLGHSKFEEWALRGRKLCHCELLL